MDKFNGALQCKSFLIHGNYFNFQSARISCKGSPAFGLISHFGISDKSSLWKHLPQLIT